MIRQTLHFKRIFILIGAAACIAAAAVSCDQLEGIDFTPAPSASLDTLSTNSLTRSSITMPTAPEQTVSTDYTFNGAGTERTVFTAPDGRILVITSYSYTKPVPSPSGGNTIGYFRVAELDVYENDGTHTANKSISEIITPGSHWNMCIDRIDGTDYLCVFLHEGYDDENMVWTNRQTRYLYSLEDYNLIPNSTVVLYRGELFDTEILFGIEGNCWFSGGKDDKLYAVSTELTKDGLPGIFVYEYDTSLTSIVWKQTVNLLTKTAESGSTLLYEWLGYNALYTCCPESSGGFVLLAKRGRDEDNRYKEYSAVIRVDENLTVTSAEYIAPIFEYPTFAAVLDSTGGLYYLRSKAGTSGHQLIHLDADYNPLSLNTVSWIQAYLVNKSDVVLTDSELLLVVQEANTIEIESYIR